MDLRGKVVLLDRRDYGDPSLKAAIEQLQTLWATYKTKPFILLGSHNGKLSAKKAEEALKKLGVTYPVYNDAWLQKVNPSEEEKRVIDGMRADPTPYGADKERIYEEINRLYPDPPGILNDYHLDTSLGPNQVGIFFNYNMAEAESPQFVTYSRRRNTSEAAKAGQIKQEIYRMRPNVEYALSSRLGGFSSYDLAEKYGGRVVSKAERDEANRAIISRVEKLLSSPMTKRGQKMNETDWVERDGGYFRIGTERFATQRGEN